MADYVEEIGRINDVGYLLTRLRLAARQNHRREVDAILERLREAGLLRDQELEEDTPHRNLRQQVNRILGTES